jgi:hypothetical protein
MPERIFDSITGDETAVIGPQLFSLGATEFGYTSEICTHFGLIRGFSQPEPAQTHLMISAV